MINRFIERLGAEQRDLVRMLRETILSSLLVGLIPLPLLFFYDTISECMSLPRSETGFPAGLFIYPLLYLLLKLVHTAFSSRADLRVLSTKINIGSSLRERLYDKWSKMSFSFYDKRPVGELLTNLWDDTSNVANLVSNDIKSLLTSLLSIIIVLVIIFICNTTLGLMVIATIPVLFLASIIIQKKLAVETSQEVTCRDNANIYFNETLNGMLLTKSMGREEYVTEKFIAYSTTLKNTSLKVVFLSFLYSPMVACTCSVSIALVIYYGGLLAGQTETVTIGTWVGLMSYVRGLFVPIENVTRFFVNLPSRLLSESRLVKRFSEEQDINDFKSIDNFPALKGDIRFEGVTFSYGTSKQILSDFNLWIKQGQSVGLVGPTGSGKTTIMNLISRFYEPTQGRIYIDGIDYTLRSIDSYRSQLGVILQNPYLFSGTLFSNLTNESPENNLKNVEALLYKLGVEDLIPRLFNEVGNEGEYLSVGEKQIVSIARIVLKDPKIILMDEFSSSLDMVTEAKLQYAVEQLMKGWTCIIIAHRLDTIMRCDRILVVKDGEIIEDGHHEVLSMKKGQYETLLEDYK